ncbi:MAG: type II toxin-antitoxin system ParD family antitoxin [Saprospiraceae bacterium]
MERSVKPGRFISASEVIMSSLRKIDREQKKMEILREAINTGKRSGYMISDK